MHQSFVALIMECHASSIRFLWRLLPRLGAVCCKRCQSRIRRVATRQNRPATPERPLDGQVGVVPCDRELGRGVVRSALLVGDDRLVFESKEAVKKAERHVELLSVPGGQRLRLPATIGGAVATDIDDHVEGASTKNADEFRGSPGAVKTAQDAAARKRKIILDKIIVNTTSTIAIERVRFHKEAALVGEDASRDHQRPGER
jgi:hypothetical protein